MKAWCAKFRDETMIVESLSTDKEETISWVSDNLNYSDLLFGLNKDDFSIVSVEIKEVSVCATKRCDCYSAIDGKGTERIQAVTPEWCKTRADGTERDFISIDLCVWPYVKACWSNGVRTLSSCCGHGKQPQSVVVEYKHINEAINTAIDTGFIDIQIFAWKNNQIDRYY